jgi:hypothetical protein
MIDYRKMRWWHWIVLSLIVGVAAGGLHVWIISDLNIYGNSLNGQRAFERALVSDAQGVKMFKDIAVHRRWMDDPSGNGPGRLAYVVAGKYCTGRVERDGALHWSPTFFVAPTPYAPTKVSAGLVGERWAGLKSPSVVNLLGAVREMRGVTYSYAWWDAFPMTMWLGASFVVVGVVSPAVMNRVLYGRWTRPAEEKGIDLSKVRSAAPAIEKEGVTAEDLDAMAGMEARLMAELEGEEGAAAAAAVGAPAQVAAAPRKLTGTTEVAAAAAVTAEEKAYGAKADDFYPTERRAGRGK